MGIMLSLVIYTVEDSSDFTACWVYQDTRITKAQLLQFYHDGVGNAL